MSDSPDPDPSSTMTDAEREAAFRQYVVPEMDVMLRVARSITGNQADAEDVVQDTLLRAYRAMDRFDGRYPRAWLLTILRNAQVNRVRRRRPELMRDPDETLSRLASTDSDGTSPETQVVEATFDSEVETAFNGLPDKFREVIQLVDLDGLAYQEAADMLEIPVGTVMSRLHRARKRIRDHLAKTGTHVPRT